MKKILSLVMAAAMLTTMAFAVEADYDATSPGASVDTSGAGILNPDKTIMLANAATIDATIQAGTSASAEHLRSYDLSTDNFTVSKKKIKKGANLVKEIKIDDDDNELIVVLNQDYALTRPGDGKAPNLIIEEVTVKAKKDIKINDVKVVKRNDEFSFTEDSGVANFKIGYEEKEAKINTTDEYATGVMNKIKKDGDTVYDTFSYGYGDIYIEGRAYDGDKVYVEVKTKANKDLLKEYPDADLSFVQLVTNGLPTSHTINVTADEDKFVYKVVDGKITASGLKWSNDDYAWVGKIRSDVSYVISDVELKAVAATEGTTGNPDTGANDVVGVAAALAVVSLVAAGAVSLKK